MADADFTVSLIDKMSGPAKAAARSMQLMEKRVESLKRASKSAQYGPKPSAAARWNANVRRLANDTKRLNQISLQAAASQRKIFRQRAAMGKLSGASLDPFHGLGGRRGVMGGQFGVGSGAGVIGAVGAAAAGAALAVGYLIKRVVEFGIRAGVAFGKAVVGAAMFAESAGSAFDVLLGKGKGGRVLKEVTEMAGQLGLPVKDTIAQFQRLLTMGFSAKEAKGLVRMTADMQALGADADKTSRVMLALSQIKATGKLQGDELMQLAEAGVPVMKVYEQLGKALGKTVPEIQKMKEAGKITADQAVKAVQAAMLDVTKQKKAGDLAEQFAGSTFTGALNRLKGQAAAQLMALGQKIAPIMQRHLMPIMKDIMQWMQSPQAAKLFDKIVAGAEAVGKHLTKVWELLGKMNEAFNKGFGEGFNEIAKGMKDVDEIKMKPGDMQAAADGLVALAHALGAIAGAAEAASKAWKNIPDFGASGFGMGGSAPGLGGIELPSALGTGMQAGMSGGGLAEQAQGVGTGIATGIATGIKNGLSAVVQAAVDIATSAISAAKNALGEHSPSKVFRGIGQNVAAGMEEGIAGGAPKVSAAAGGMINPSKMGGTTQNISAPAKVSMTIQAADDPQATAAAVAATLEAKIGGMFEQAALQVAVVGASG